jgi:hypothetical protein
MFKILAFIAGAAVVVFAVHKRVLTYESADKVVDKTKEGVDALRKKIEGNSNCPSDTNTKEQKDHATEN